MLQIDGPSAELCLVDSGRKFPQLIARLGELSAAITRLGPGAMPYDKSFEGLEVSPDNSVDAALEPYKSLDSSRLLFHGKGHWDPTTWLSDSLVMAYRNPDVLLFDRDLADLVRPKMTDPVKELASLAKLWDRQGLLVIHNHDVGAQFPHEFVKIFNCLKSSEVDRQIGDRRGRNGVEAKLEGVSHNLPTGFDLLDLAIQLPDQCLTSSVTDRRDFYHQFAVSRTRAISNTLGPGLPWELVSDTKAFNAFLLQNSRRAKDRLSSGDKLVGAASRFQDVKWQPGQDVFMCFGSILQGDHGGVEYACDAHCCFLQESNLLSERSRVVSDKPFFNDRLLEGLVIDDYFSVAVSDRHDPSALTEDVKCFQTAKAAYEKEQILGSDAKDVIGQRVAKIVGAQINSSEEALDASRLLAGCLGLNPNVSAAAHGHPK